MLQLWTTEETALALFPVGLLALILGQGCPGEGVGDCWNHPTVRIRCWRFLLSSDYFKFIVNYSTWHAADVGKCRCSVLSVSRPWWRRGPGQCGGQWGVGTYKGWHRPGVKFWTKRCKGSRRKMVGVTAWGTAGGSQYDGTGEVFHWVPRPLIIFLCSFGNKWFWIRKKWILSSQEQNIYIIYHCYVLNDGRLINCLIINLNITYEPKYQRFSFFMPIMIMTMNLAWRVSLEGEAQAGLS